MNNIKIMNNFEMIKKFIKRIPPLFGVLVYFNKIKVTGTIFVRILKQTEKIKLFLFYGKKFGCKVFVETGTLRGDTIYDCKDYSDELFSIELSHDFFIFSKKRFENYSHIHLFEGDSGALLPEIIKFNNKSVLFWLDAHYSGGETARGEQDTPIVKELDFILKNLSDFCILIDDARCFNGKNGYPRIKFLKRMVKSHNMKGVGPALELQVKNDIIRINRK